MEASITSDIFQYRKKIILVLFVLMIPPAFFMSFGTIHSLIRQQQEMNEWSYSSSSEQSWVSSTENNDGDDDNDEKHYSSDSNASSQEEEGEEDSKSGDLNSTITTTATHLRG